VLHRLFSARMQGIASPHCAMLLAVYGAEVIKVEPPDESYPCG
jgi:crotonobetainyl-CoA:carnitine CoA-transferase CaiB-like acyl-CoA transferase